MVYSLPMSHARIDYRALEVSERLELVTDIWDSIAEETNAVRPELSSGQLQELQRRLDAHQQDPLSSLPWKDVRQRLLGQENSR